MGMGKEVKRMSEFKSKRLLRRANGHEVPWAKEHDWLYLRYPFPHKTLTLHPATLCMLTSCPAHVLTLARCHCALCLYLTEHSSLPSWHCHLGCFILCFLGGQRLS
jgi:hypothetical protein